MSASEQTSAAQQFVTSKINSQYGISTDLHRPSSSHAGIEALAGSQASEQITSNGIQPPSNADTIEKKGHERNKEVADQLTNFTDNSGNIIGNQVIEQAKVGVNVVKNTAELGSMVIHDVVSPDEIVDKNK